jgi:hypothetical protein
MIVFMRLVGHWKLRETYSRRKGQRKGSHFSFCSRTWEGKREGGAKPSFRFEVFFSVIAWVFICLFDRFTVTCIEGKRMVLTVTAGLRMAFSLGVGRTWNGYS